MGWLTPISLQSFFVIRKYSVHLLHIILHVSRGGEYDGFKVQGNEEIPSRFGK